MTIEHERHPEIEGLLVETDESFDRRMEETYRPDQAKPWRVTWGFGAFQDFATEEEAQRYRFTIPDRLRPQPVFNAVEEWSR